MRALVLGLAAAALGCQVIVDPPAHPPFTGAGDMMVVANRPNNLHLVDLGAPSLTSSWEVSLTSISSRLSTTRILSG